MKKTKKKSKGTKRQKLIDDDDDDFFPAEPAQADANAMDVDSKDGLGNMKKRKATSDVFADDDDFQASLALQRKSALKRRKRMRPEDIAKQLKQEAEEPTPDEESQTGGLVIGEISEFVAGLSKRDDEAERRQKHQKEGDASGIQSGWRTPEGEDHAMGDADGIDGDEGTSTERGLEASGAEDKVMEEEKEIGSGMGATLALLRERGLIEESRGDSSHQNLMGRQEFLRRKRELEEELDEKARLQRERDRTSGKLERMSRADREEYARQQNAWRDHQHSRRMAELIQATYKPDVQLKYTDEHGRTLDSKEAFKHLSHQFHGKGSGKGKTEKKLKQIEEEKRRAAQSLFDATQGSGMSAATSQQLKKRREAGVRLG